MVGSNMEDKHKHLEFIQAVIARLSRNSLLIKGWSVTLVTVTLVLSAASEKPTLLTALTLIPLIYFWLLDGQLYSKERDFRTVYDRVRKLDEKDIDFLMDNEQRERIFIKWIPGFLVAPIEDMWHSRSCYFYRTYSFFIFL